MKLQDLERLEFDAAESKPPPYLGVRLQSADGRIVSGVWTGKEWWAEGERVTPSRWQCFDRGDPRELWIEDAFQPPPRRLSMECTLDPALN